MSDLGYGLLATFLQNWCIEAKQPYIGSTTR